MKFRTHIRNLHGDVAAALNCGTRDEVIARFRGILSRAKSLFKTDHLDFWIEQLDRVEPREIAMTRYGLKEARDYWLRREGRDLGYVCEYLFTFCEEDDFCDLQSQYHYYYFIPESRVFRESQLGCTDLGAAVNDPRHVRVAKVSELDRCESCYVT